MRGNGKERRLVCECCGEGFPAKNQRQGDILCPKCRARAAKQKARMKDKTAGVNMELTSVAARARQARMTYGQYVASLRG